MGVIKVKNSAGEWEAVAAATALSIGSATGREIGFAEFTKLASDGTAVVDLTNYVDSEDDIVACMYRTSGADYYSIMFIPWANDGRGYYVEDADYFSNDFAPLPSSETTTFASPYVWFESGMLHTKQTPNNVELAAAAGYRILLFYYL